MEWTAAFAALLVAPGIALAQPVPPPGSPPPPPGAWDRDAFWRGAPEGPRERIQFLEDRINRGLSGGSLDPQEANRAQHELDGVRGWLHRMHWEDDGALTPGQRARVQQRLDDIRRQIRWMRHNGW